MSERSRSFSPRALMWLIGLGGGSFALALLLTGFADDLGDPISASADSFSYSAIGHRAFIETLAAAGFEVSRRRTDRTVVLDPSTVLLLAEPRPGPPDDGEAEEDVDEGLDDDPGAYGLARLVEMASTQQATAVVVLPKWLGMPSPTRPGWIEAAQRLMPAMVTQSVQRLAALDGVELGQASGGASGLECETPWGPWSVALDTAQLLSHAPHLEPVVTCEGHLLVARVADREELGSLYVVTDPDLLNNHGLGRGDNAALVAALLTDELGADAVVFDETIHGFVRNTGMISELLRFPLVLALLQGLLVAGFVIWSGTGRLGKPRSLPSALGSGKEVLIDNTAQLISVAGHSFDALRRYYAQTLRALSTHFYLPASLPEPVIVSRLRRIGRTRDAEIDIDDLIAEIRRLGESGRQRPEAVVRAAVKLHRFREELTHVD